MPEMSFYEPDDISTRIDVTAERYQEPIEEVPVNPTKCPHCGGKGLVKSTQKKTQYRQCTSCGERYKTQKAG